MARQTVSLVVSTYNRSEQLKKCLDSVKGFVDDIIVVDNTSSDSTVTIAKKYTKHVFTRENNLMLNVNKNYGFGKVTTDWILYLDDDEEVTPELKGEIKEILSEDTKQNGFYIPRKNIIFGKWIAHAGWYPDNQLRLFRKGKAKFPEEHVHEMVKVEGEVGVLSKPFIHYNYQTVASFIQKTATIYAPNEAEVLLKNGYTFHFLDAIRMPFQEFLSRYFAREGYKDGLHGLVLSLLMASYHLFVFAYLWEKKGFPEETENAVKNKFTQEVKKMQKDLLYWQNNEDLKNAPGIQKLYFLIKRFLKR